MYLANSKPDADDGNIEISKINFPKVIILTQECDSIQDYNNRKDCYEKIRDNQEIKTNQFLLSTIVAPLYNLSDIVTGDHLSNSFKREDARARIRVNIRRLLIKYNYPPVKREGAVDKVIKQSELKYSTE